MSKLPNLDHLTDAERQQLVENKLQDLLAHIMVCPTSEMLAWGQTMITAAIRQPIHAALVTGDTSDTEGLPLDKAIFTAANRATVRAITDLQNDPKFAITAAIRSTLINEEK